MADARTARINTAVDAILELCTREGRQALRQCIDDLILDKTWTVEDIRIVRDAVQKRLDEREAGR